MARARKAAKAKAKTAKAKTGRPNNPRRNAVKQANYSSRQTAGLIAPPIDVHRNVVWALQKAERITQAEATDRERIAEECAQVLAAWAEQWVELLGPPQAEWWSDKQPWSSQDAH
jgi:hypothetical protein